MNLAVALKVAGTLVFGSVGCWGIEQFGDVLHPLLAKALQVGVATVSVFFIARLLGVH